MPTLPGLDKNVFKDPAPPPSNFEIAPITIPNGTTLVTTKTTNETIDNVNELIDYVSGDNGPDFIPQLAIDSLVVDLSARELLVNKGAANGYAGLDASLELLLTNFPTGSSLQVLRRNVGNTALEFATISAGGGQVDSVVGTTNRISVNSADPVNPIVDIDAAYVGQTSITTLGTITTGVWNGTDIALANIVNGTANQIIKTNAGGTALEFGLIGDANTDTFTTTKITTLSKSLLNTEIVYTDQANVYTAGVRQDFLSLLAGTSGLNVGGIAGNPTTQVDGDIWLNTTSDTLFARINGANVNLGAGAGGGEANTISSLGGGTVLTAGVPKSGVNLQTVSIATTAPIAHATVTDLLTFSLDPLVNADIAIGAEIDVAKLADGDPGQFIRTDAAGTGVEYADDIASITFIIDGGGTVLTTGIHGDLEIPYNCTIERVTLLADQTGDVVIDLFVDTFGNYPPVIGDSIVAAAPPTITTDDNSQDTTLTGWTTALVSGSTIRYNVNSATTIERVTIALLVRKTG